MGVFKGIRTKNSTLVTYDDRQLDLRLDLVELSPMGFEWGYNGSGSKQLAIAILSTIIIDEYALKYYEKFFEDFILTIDPDKDEWEIDELDIKDWLSDNDIPIAKMPIMTPRFSYEKVSTNKYGLYLDNNILGLSSDFTKENGINTYIDNKMMIIIEDDFTKLLGLYPNDLPQTIKFRFGEFNEFEIIDNIYFASIEKNKNIKFEYSLFIGYYHESIKISPYRFGKVFYIILNNSNGFTADEPEHINDELLEINFYFETSNNKKTLQEIVDENIQTISRVYDEAKNIIDTENSNFEAKFYDTENANLEARFDFPKQYQGILKSYMMYFEEFLKDLSIEADVNIKNIDDDTILSVIPKNQDEALENIANALKAYITSPVLVKDISIEEKMDMNAMMQNLHEQCSHLKNQLKNITVDAQQKQIMLQQNCIEETKNILIELGINENQITENNTMLLNSLKEIKINQKSETKKTFFSSWSFSLKGLGFGLNIKAKKDKF